MTFAEAEHLFSRRRKGSWEKLLENNTHLIQTTYEGKEGYGVRLHGTIVVIILPDKYILQARGFHTHTTKDRINKYSPANVYQKDYVWYMGWHKKRPIEFYDGIEIDLNGEVIQEPEKIDLFGVKDVHCSQADSPN